MINRENVLKLGARRSIYNFILKNPGMHLREISRKMNIPKTTLNYHLRYLKKQDLVTTHVEGEYKRYFVTNEIGRKEKKILSLMRQEVPRNILLCMIFFSIFSQTELSKMLEKDPATIAFHLNKLRKLGIIREYWHDERKAIIDNVKRIVKRNKIGAEKLYTFGDDPGCAYYICNSLIICKNNYFDQDFINEALDLINEVSYLDKSKKRVMNYKNKKIVNLDGAIDSFIEFFNEVFPPIYYA